jgi:tetratricopeptide (TPR) repeat protein
MAPEQVTGRRQDLRVDVYAFGATLFEAATGRPPHDVDEAPALFHAILHRDAPPLRTLRPEAPRALEVLLARCLSRAAEFRPADGEVLLAEVRAIRGTGAPPSAAAGVAEPAPAARPARPVPRDPARPLPLQGRAAEMEALRTAIEDAEGGRGTLVLVEGESGSGKSRILSEAAGAARARAAAVIECTGGEYAGTPFRAIREALLARAREEGAATPEAAAELLRRAAPENEAVLPALRWVLAPGGDPGAAPARSDMLRALGALLRALLRERPALLAADDAHLLDEGTLEFLSAIAEEGRSWPLVLALSFRPPALLRADAPFAARLPRLRAVPGVRRLELGPLSEGAVAGLVHTGLRVSEEEACRIAPLLHRKSGGNPLFLLECLRLLEEEGRITEDRTGRRIRRRITTLALPPRLHEIALRRIVGLPARDREVLGAVAVDPAGLPAETLARCLDAKEREVLRVLQRLVAVRGLVARGERGFAIPHAEIREAVYAELLPELRSAYHAEAARALEERGLAATEPARLARHWRLGGEPAKAVPLFVDAARRLREAHSAGEALALVDEALGCAGAAGSHAASLEKARCLALEGDLPAARSLLEALSAEGEPGERFDAVLHLSQLHDESGNCSRAWDLLPVARDLADTGERKFRLHFLTAQIASRMNRSGDAVEALRNASGHLGEVAPNLRLDYLIALGAFHWRADRYEEAIEAWGPALELAEALGQQEPAVTLLVNLSLAHSDLGRDEEAIRFGRQAEERARVLGMLRLLVHARLHLADLLTGALQPEEADGILALVGPDVRRLGGGSPEFFLLARRAELELARGRPAEALAACDRALGLPDLPPRLAVQAELCRAEALLASGRDEEALRASREARGRALSLSSPLEGEDGLAIAATCLRAMGKEGPERAEVGGLTEPLSWRAALAAAREQSTGEARLRLLETAEALTRNRRDRKRVADEAAGIRGADAR